MLIIGKCLAGNGRLTDGTTLAEKYPKRYQNVLADYIALVVAQAKADQALASTATVAPMGMWNDALDTTP